MKLGWTRVDKAAPVAAALVTAADALALAEACIATTGAFTFQLRLEEEPSEGVLTVLQGRTLDPDDPKARRLALELIIPGETSRRFYTSSVSELELVFLRWLAAEGRAAAEDMTAGWIERRYDPSKNGWDVAVGED